MVAELLAAFFLGFLSALVLHQYLHTSSPPQSAKSAPSAPPALSSPEVLKSFASPRSPSTTRLRVDHTARISTTLSPSIRKVKSAHDVLFTPTSSPPASALRFEHSSPLSSPRAPISDAPTVSYAENAYASPRKKKHRSRSRSGASRNALTRTTNEPYQSDSDSPPPSTIVIPPLNLSGTFSASAITNTENADHPDGHSDQEDSHSEEALATPPTTKKSHRGSQFDSPRDRLARLVSFPEKVLSRRKLRDSGGDEKAESPANEEQASSKKGHSRSSSDEHSSLKRFSSSLKRMRAMKEVVELPRPRQNIIQSAVKMGWVRVQSITLGDKHLWSKRFLILCRGELFLMRSKELFAECTFYMELLDQELTVQKRKDSKCDILLSGTNELSQSLPNIYDAKERKQLRLSLREDVDEWLLAFSCCLNVAAPESFGNLHSEPGVHHPPPLPTNSLPDTFDFEDDSPSPSSTSPVVHFDISSPVNTFVNDSHEADWDQELTRKLQSVQAPPAKILLSESVYLYSLEKGTWFKRLIKLDSGILHLYKAIHGNISLQGMIYLAGCQIEPLNMQHNPVDSIEQASILRITRPSKIGALMSMYSPAGSKLPGYSEARYADMQFNSPALLKAAAEALEKAIAMNVAPLEDLVPLTPQQSAALYACDYSELAASPRTLQPVGNTKFHALNLLLSRYFLDVQQSAEFLKEASLFTKEKLDETFRPDFLGPLEVLSMDFSTIDARVIDAQFCNFPDNPREIIGEILLESLGAIKAELKTHLNVNFFGTVSITVLLVLKNIQGKLHVHIPEDIGSRTEMFFAQIPTYELGVDIRLTEKKIPLAATLPLLEQFFVDSWRNTVREKLVYPNKSTFFLPFAGREISMRIEQVGVEILCLDIQKSGRKRLIEALKLSTSRFIDEIIPLSKVDVIPEVFDANCEIVGFSLEGDIWRGHLGVEELVAQFRSAFFEVSFSVSDLQVEEQRLTMQWRCQGRLMGSIWGHHDPEAKLLSMEGSLSLSCIFESNPNTIYGTLAKLTRVHFNWNPSTFQQIFSLPQDEPFDLRSSSLPLCRDITD